MMSALNKVVLSEFEKKMIKLISAIAILPTINPVNGKFKACRKPPKPDSFNAHSAVSLNIIV